MKCNQFVNKTLGESSIHGFPYFVKRELHWTEKFFWFCAIILAAYFSIDICYNQWERFRDNPIVYAMELAWSKSHFPFVGVTLCSNFTNTSALENIIGETWNVSRESNATLYEHYFDFLKVVNVLNIKTLNNLEPFENDANLKDFDYNAMLLKIHNHTLPSNAMASTANHKHHVDPSPASSAFDSASPSLSPTPPSALGFDTREMLYAGAITEYGICRTTSQQTKYTNPFGELKPLMVSPRRFCDVMNECNTKIFPKVGDTGNLFIFLHNVEDILTPFDYGTILRRASIDGSLTIELLLSLTTAEAEVRNLPVAYRKCRYNDENNLKYFDIYRPSMCNVECRVNAAFSKCGCKPFFYVVAPHMPVCDIKGMLCLSRHKWPESASCNCLQLCEEAQFVGMQTVTQRDDSTKFEKTIIVKLFLPRMAVKRRVVFSTDQLIMSFGGAIGLFLGASFISLYGLVFVLSEYIFSNSWACVQRKPNGKQTPQEVQTKGMITMVKSY